MTNQHNKIFPLTMSLNGITCPVMSTMSKKYIDIKGNNPSSTLLLPIQKDQLMYIFTNGTYFQDPKYCLGPSRITFTGPCDN